MKQAFVKLHLSILFAGMTGVLGKLISLDAAVLVWYRMAMAAALLAAICAVQRRIPHLPWRQALRIAFAGVLLGIHWAFFYASIKASNVSIGVVCFSTVGFFTALFEPIAYRKRISVRELAFSLLTIAGIGLIFHFDTRYRVGIALGCVSSAVAAIFSIINKRLGAEMPARTVLFYEMTGGIAGLSVLAPFYLLLAGEGLALLPKPLDWLYLGILASVCTIGMYALQIQALRKISAFTMNLSYNLEPLYSIIIAMLLFDEARELNASFFAGLALIILSVALQTFTVARHRNATA